MDPFINFRCEVIVPKHESRTSIIDMVQGMDAIFWNTLEILDTEIIEASGEYLNINLRLIFSQ